MYQKYAIVVIITLIIYQQLSVTRSNNLNWSSHITINNKNKNSLRCIRDNVKTKKQTTRRGCIQAAYRIYACPQVEYCSTIWHPRQKHLTHRIEMVQRSAARYVQNDYHYTSSVTNMLRELKRSSLEQHRNQASLIMLHKYATNRSMQITVTLQIHKQQMSNSYLKNKNTT